MRHVEMKQKLLLLSGSLVLGSPDTFINVSLLMLNVLFE